jgi:hypothetical protein
LVRKQKAAIARVSTAQISREDVKQNVQGLVDGYFRTDRPILLAELHDEAAFKILDGLMQELLALAQRRSLKRRYLEILSDLERAWRAFELRALTSARPLIGEPAFKTHQEAIFQTLQRICPKAAKCYEQALLDLAEPGRMSWRGTVSELREALRELLDHLAPDDSVTKAAGFKLEEGAKGPTMKQKARFVLRARHLSDSDRRPVEEATDTVEENVGAFVRTAYTRSSVSVHTEPSRKDAVSVLRFVELALAELLELDT